MIRKVFRKFFRFFYDVKVNSLDLSKPEVNLQPYSTYVLLRNLVFSPEIRLNRMDNFKSLLRWINLNLHCMTICRNYPLCQPPVIGEIPVESLPRRVKTHEEIMQILPYVREFPLKKLYKLPITRHPAYKSYFSREQMKFFRERLAEKNGTGRANVDIFEIYDRFFHKFFSNVGLAENNRDLEYLPNPAKVNETPQREYCLVLGKKRDTGEFMRVIINSTDWKNNDFQ